MLAARPTVEAFHLVFLRALMAKGEDKTLVALKGGCNLRFFFGSVRYSEDIDFDVTTIAKGTLTNKVERLLAGPTVVSPLRALGVEITDFSAPKQTDTTQRWKVGLKSKGVTLPVRTKIEFSRRRAIEGAVFEATTAEATRPYGQMPVLATHYALTQAIAQKVDALAHRAEPQARDVFDLAHLFAHPDASRARLAPIERAWLDAAIEHAIEISYDAFASKVVAFLEPVHTELFGGREAWDSMQATVVAELEARR